MDCSSARGVCGVTSGRSAKHRRRAPADVFRLQPRGVALLTSLCRRDTSPASAWGAASEPDLSVRPQDRHGVGASRPAVYGGQPHRPSTVMKYLLDAEAHASAQSQNEPVSSTLFSLLESAELRLDRGDSNRPDFQDRLTILKCLRYLLKL